MKQQSNSLISLNYALIGLGTVLFAAVFHPMFLWMAGRFLEPSSYYSHGFLIPLFAAYLIPRKRALIASLSVSSSRWGLPLILAGMSAHLAGGGFFGIGCISGFSFVIVLFGLSMYLLGGAITKAIMFPVASLALMIPLPEVLILALTFRLKMIAASLATWIVSFINVPASGAGSVIFLPNGILTVDDECSGISSLISLFTLSLFFFSVAVQKASKRVLLILLSFPIALLANTFRIVFLILAAYIYGVKTATEGLLHYGAGITLWITALGMLFAARRMFVCTETR